MTPHRTVKEWEWTGSDRGSVVLSGYNQQDEEVVRREFELSNTEIKDDDGEWKTFEDDSGGWPYPTEFFE